MIVQRLLRGRILYAILGVLLVSLYARVRPGLLGMGETTRVATRPEATLEWWPKELDAASLQQVASEQPHLMLLLSLVAFGGAGLGLAGLTLGLWGLWTRRSRSARGASSPPLPSWSFAELARITILTLMTASLMPFIHIGLSALVGTRLDAHLWVTVSMLVLDLFVMLLILAFAIGKASSMWRAVGLSKPIAWTSVRASLRSYVAVFPWLFLLLFVAVETTRWLGIQPPAEPIQELIFHERRPLVLGLTIVLACALGPMAEELFYRGVVYTAIRARASRTVAMLLSAALFSLSHANLVGFLPIMLLGCLLAHVYERTGSLAASLTVHVVHNLLLMGAALVFRELLFAVQG